MDKQLDLQKAIAKLEKPWPNDDFISNYSDFLKHRDLIIYHRFNPVVFEQLLDLAISHWTANQKVSRSSLVLTIRRYVSVQGADLNNLDLLGKAKVFELFKLTLLHPEFIPQGQRVEIEQRAAQLVYGLLLEGKQLIDLCELALHHPKALNRVLRYPSQSSIISNWVAAHFEHPVLQLRRAEAVGWMLDTNPEFEVDEAIIRRDFEHMNDLDRTAVTNVVMNDAVNELFNTDWLSEFPIDRSIPQDPFESPKKSPRIAFGKDRIVWIKRFYPVPTVHDKTADDWVPDFEALEFFFEANHASLLKVTMVWGIAYSRIDKKLKSKLLRKYYCPETHYSISRVATKQGLLEVLKWMLKQLK
jgi:hypothetical protein